MPLAREPDLVLLLAGEGRDADLCNGGRAGRCGGADSGYEDDDGRPLHSPAWCHALASAAERADPHDPDSPPVFVRSEKDDRTAAHRHDRNACIPGGVLALPWNAYEHPAGAAESRVD